MNAGRRGIATTHSQGAQRVYPVDDGDVAAVDLEDDDVPGLQGVPRLVERGGRGLAGRTPLKKISCCKAPSYIWSPAQEKIDLS